MRSKIIQCDVGDCCAQISCSKIIDSHRPTLDFRLGKTGENNRTVQHSALYVLLVSGDLEKTQQR